MLRLCLSEFGALAFIGAGRSLTRCSKMLPFSAVVHHATFLERTSGLRKKQEDLNRQKKLAMQKEISFCFNSVNYISQPINRSFLFIRLKGTFFLILHQVDWSRQGGPISFETG